MTTTLTRQQLDHAADLAGCHEYTLRNYPGRFMYGYSGHPKYGETCLGIVTSSSGEAFAIMASHAIELALDSQRIDTADAFLLAIRGARTDLMGRDVVTYFPTIAYEGDDTDEEDE